MEHAAPNSTPVQLHVIGCGADGPASLPPPGQALLGRCRAVAAPRRLLPALRRWWAARGDGPCPPLAATNRPEALLRWLAAQLAEPAAAAAPPAPIAVLSSGDPLWFGIGRLLLERLPAVAIRLHPSPTCLQLAFARLQRPWQDAAWVSIHGRDPERLVDALRRRPAALAVLPDPGRGGAGEVRRLLRASGLEAAYGFWLCERLGGSGERVRQLPPGRPLPADLDPLHLVVLLARPPAAPEDGDLPLFGLDDGLWRQHPEQPGLMSKREVRVQLLADLALPERGVLWDLGAGVGSIGLEALRLRPGLRLYAVERRSGGADVIAANARRLAVSPAAVIEAEALSLLRDAAALPDPDRVLLGGGGRRRRELLDGVLDRLRPAGVVVIPLATLEALAELRPLLEQRGLTVRISQLQAWRGVPLAEGTRLLPMNPVLILSGTRRAGSDGGAGGDGEDDRQQARALRP
jgi:precorrin-6Y C5,15-methyltransferase (decarboxylating)